MGFSVSSQAISYRNTQSVSIAVILVAMGAWLFVHERNAPTFVGRENVRAVVIGIETSAGEGAKQGAASTAFQFLEVRLPDGKVIPVKIDTRNRRPLRAGDSIPMIQEFYDDDSTTYAIDHQEWKLNSF